MPSRKKKNPQIQACYIYQLWKKGTVFWINLIARSIRWSIAGFTGVRKSRLDCSAHEHCIPTEFVQQVCIAPHASCLLGSRSDWYVPLEAFTCLMEEWLTACRSATCALCLRCGAHQAALCLPTIGEAVQGLMSEWKGPKKLQSFLMLLVKKKFLRTSLQSLQ